ncbi:nuclear transport factor 2 family protein [Rathayibacter sp. YIM 133350]|uniref:nuclear transport factor 2 family protein n=1 Tax=Rathayibacter sp. YIM 133350 TaxID=3131992 RepID=UPI00307E06C0
MSDINDWMQRYIAAWDSNDPDHIRALFTDDAEYYTLPGRPPKKGVDAIVEWWLEARDEPGDYTFRWEPVALTPSTAVIQGFTDYRDRPGYHNLWVIRLEPDGRANSFTEWWVEVPNAEHED